MAEGVGDVKSYTQIAAQESDAQCTQDSIVTPFFTLIANKVNGEKAIIGLSILAVSRYPDGGQTLFDLDGFDDEIFSFIANVITYFLNLATSGPLEGRYLLFRSHYTIRDYLKKCSSVLGYSYIIVGLRFRVLVKNKLLDTKGVVVNT